MGYEWGSMGERTAVLYPDGTKAAYEYNGAMQLTAMKVFSGEKQEQTVRYSYDEAGRLAGKQFPGGSTEYRYSQAGRIGEILHKGADFTERLRYAYDVMGNKVTAEKDRPGSPEDSGIFSYGYDELNRLTGVAQNGKILRSYSYDAFGNRSSKTEYQTAGSLTTTYRYNARNQLIQETAADTAKDYAYDHRGNLLSVTSGGEVLRAYGFDAANQMESAMEMEDGRMKKAACQYNGLGHRMGQSITAAGGTVPDRIIRYTLDLTRQYHNLLQKTTSMGSGGSRTKDRRETYFWDGNVTGMEEEGRDHFYFQDDLGSPVRLADGTGRSEEVYGFDEFGNDIRTGKDIFRDSMQSFGFTGYQMDGAGGLYFAQARRYDAGAGRFISEDLIKGHTAVPYTMNHYSYCFNRPMDLVDLNGMWPSLKDIGNGIESTISSVVETVSDVTQSVVEGIKETATNVIDATNDFYAEHKETIDTVAKVVVAASTVATIGIVAAGIATASVATGGACLAVLAAVGVSAGIGGVSGGVTNVTTGGSFINGFVGGSINGALTAAGTCIWPSAVGMSNFIGGTVGTAITEGLNALDDPENANSLPKIATLSVATGLAQAGVGKVGNLLGSGAGLKAGTLANGIWNGFSNLLGFSIGDISYIQTGAAYDSVKELWDKINGMSNGIEKSKE